MEEDIHRILSRAFKDDEYSSDFWRSDGTGAAMAGSMKGFAMLAESFKANLPEIGVDHKA